MNIMTGYLSQNRSIIALKLVCLSLFNRSLRQETHNEIRIGPEFENLSKPDFKSPYQHADLVQRLTIYRVEAVGLKKSNYT